MEPIISIDAILARWGEDELAVVCPNGQGGIDEDRLDGAIDDVTSEIATYVQGKYPWPLPSVPIVLQRLAADMVVYHLASMGNSHSEIKENRYKGAVRFLTAVSKGEIELLTKPGKAAKSKASTIGHVSTELTRETLKGAF